MVNRILNLVGYLGMAMVVASLGIRFGYPAKEQWAYYLAWGGLVCVLLYTLSQWRESSGLFPPPGTVTLAARACSSCSASWWRSTTSAPARTSAGT
jgi:hypothetical protein